MAQFDFTIIDFLTVCKNAVRLSAPTSPVKPCLQMQTWRLLQRDPRQNAEIGTPTLGAVATDKNSPFFYSKQWELSKFDPGKLGYQYPILTGFEIVNKPTGVFSGTILRTYTIELAVLDVFRPDKCQSLKSSGCDGRPINQIFFDTESLLDSALRYIGGTVIATTTTDPVEKIYNIDALKAAMPGQYDVKFDMGAFWKSDNNDLQFTRVEYPTQNIYGTKTLIKIRVQSCPVISFLDSLSDKGVIGFESGCTNC